MTDEEEDEFEVQPIKRRTVPLWPNAGRALGLGRNATYDAAARGEIPTLRFGRKIVVSKKVLARMLEG